MRQPEDNKTMDMLEQKRGRGRPRKENALTPAERARRYRERKAELRDLLSRDAVKPVTEKDKLDDHAQRQFDGLRCDLKFAYELIDDKNLQLNEANVQIGMLKERIREVIRLSSEGKRVPASYLKQLRACLE